ncbi:MAG TPA: deoxyribonuclease IV [Thermoplasmata archaeon]|nr:deoxyribonuclease IV [Thermoplasmata archaeon]
MWLGAHLGIADGLPQAVKELTAIHGEALQIFSKSPQMWAGPPVAPEAAEAFRAAVREEGVRATAVHHGYLANLASPKKFTLVQSRKAFRDEIARAELLGVDGLIFHPGAHVKSGEEAGLKTIAESLTGALAEHPDGKVRLLLENAAGQGTTLGSTFEQLKTVLALVDRPDRLGVTIDTCHLFASGVDFRTDEQYGRFLDRVRDTIGLETVRAFHLNDAKADLGSHLDRHENIGKGQIGLEGFRHLVTDATWDRIPGYLETPLEDDSYARYAEDLATLRSLIPQLAPPEPRSAPAARRGHSSKAKGS